MRVLVVSDTHAPRRWRGVPDALASDLASADVILHAGDACTPDVLDELAAHAPVHAVLGNNDSPGVAAWGATETLHLELDGLPVAMVHDSGPRQGRGTRMRRRFPDAGLVVFGHSHIPVDAVEASVHLFNPGSPSDPRRQPTGTYGVLDIAGGRLVRSMIVGLPAIGRTE